MEKDFLNRKKKYLKICPKCKIYIEKNEECNHMTCSNYKFESCWLWEGKYEYGHYNQGKCKRLQFSSRPRNVEEVNRLSLCEKIRRCFNCFCECFIEAPQLLLFIICISIFLGCEHPF